MFNTIYTSVLPRIEERYKSKVQVIFRQQIQPWHPSSTLVHEAGAAVLRLTPSKFYEFSATLFAHQNEYFDVNVVNETRNDTYKRLACLAQTIGVEGAKVLELLHVSDKPGKDGALNSGNTVTDDVKFMVKASDSWLKLRIADSDSHVIDQSFDRCSRHTNSPLQCKLTWI